MLSIDFMHKIQVLYLCNIALDLCAWLTYNRDSEKGTVYGRAPEKEEIGVPVKYKMDILSALKEAGYSTYKLRKEKLLGESVLQQIRDGVPVSWANLGRICTLLDCQPGDLLEYVKDGTMERDKQKNQ